MKRLIVFLSALLFLWPLSAQEIDESKMFAQDTMIKTNTQSLLTDPNKGTGKKFQIGGTIWVNSGLSFSSRGGDSFSDWVSAQPWYFNSDLQFYVDSRLNSHLRVFARMQASYSAAENTNSYLLSEAFIDFDLNNTLFFRVGRQKFTTGLGRQWKVTDWLNSSRSAVLDSAFSDKLREGINGIKMSLNSQVWRGVFFLDVTSSDRVNKVGAYAKSEWRIGTFELVLSAHARKGQQPVWGVGMSAGFLGLDWYAEASFAGESWYKKVRLKSVAERGADPFANIEVYREDGFLPQIVTGLSYNNNARKFTLSAEYFFNPAGYTDASLYAYALMKKALVSNYLGKHYLSLSVSFSELLSTTDSLSTIIVGNMSDQSFALYPNYTFKVNDDLLVSFGATFFFGKKNGEYTFPLVEVGSSGITGFSIANPLSMAISDWSEPDIARLNVRMEVSF